MCGYLARVDKDAPVSSGRPSLMRFLLKDAYFFLLKDAYFFFFKACLPGLFEYPC